MNHDYAHCMDYNASICPEDCFRGQLVRDLENRKTSLSYLPIAWAHLKGTDLCKMGKEIKKPRKLKKNEAEIYKMLNEGKNQTEIAKQFGVTKQAISAYIHKASRERRTRLALFNDIPYKGLRNFMLETPGMTVSKLTAKIYGSNQRNTHAKISRLLSGAEVYFTIENIWAIINFTGMTFEELFKKE